MLLIDNDFIWTPSFEWCVVYELKFMDTKQLCSPYFVTEDEEQKTS